MVWEYPQRVWTLPAACSGGTRSWSGRVPAACLGSLAPATFLEVPEVYLESTSSVSGGYVQHVSVSLNVFWGVLAAYFRCNPQCVFGVKVLGLVSSRWRGTISSVVATGFLCCMQQFF